MQETVVRFLSWEDPLENERLPTPVFWPGEFHVLYCLWGCKALDMMEGLSLPLSRLGTSPEVQWLRPCASMAGGAGSIPGQGTKVPYAVLLLFSC